MSLLSGATLFGIAMILVPIPRRGGASVCASDPYPYCQLSSWREGGMSCYFGSEINANIATMHYQLSIFRGGGFTRMEAQKQTTTALVVM
jgi:hypothetical protein